MKVGVRSAPLSSNPHGTVDAVGLEIVLARLQFEGVTAIGQIDAEGARMGQESLGRLFADDVEDVAGDKAVAGLEVVALGFEFLNAQLKFGNFIDPTAGEIARLMGGRFVHLQTHGQLARIDISRGIDNRLPCVERIRLMRDGVVESEEIAALAVERVGEAGLDAALVILSQIARMRRSVRVLTISFESGLGAAASAAWAV